MDTGVLLLGIGVDLGSFMVDGECGITQCWLRDRGAATLEKHERSQWPCRATVHGYRLGCVGVFRAVRGLRVVRG